MNTTATHFKIERYYALELSRKVDELRLFPRYLASEILADVIKYLNNSTK